MSKFNDIFNKIVAEEKERYAAADKKLEDYKKNHQDIITEGFLKALGNVFRHPTKKGKRKEMVNTFNNFTTSNGFTNKKDEIANPNGNHNVFWKKYDDENDSIIQLYRSPKFMADPTAQLMRVQVTLFQNGTRGDSESIEIKPSTRQDEIGSMLMDVFNDFGGEALKLDNFTTTHTEEGADESRKNKTMVKKETQNSASDEAEREAQAAEDAQAKAWAALEAAQAKAKAKIAEQPKVEEPPKEPPKEQPSPAPESKKKEEPKTK